MTKPRFSVEEQYLIDSVRTGGTSDFSFELGYLIPSFVLAGCGIYWGHPFPVFAALGVIAAFKAWEWSYQRKWAPHWQSIFDKYEEAVAELDDDG